MLLRLVRNPFILFLSLAFIFGSCSKDKELDRVKFIGTYGVVETCGSGNDTYDIVITESSTGDDKVVIANLYNIGGTITATVSGNNITITSQQAQTVTYNGSGNINGNVLTISFSVTDGAVADTCSATCSKK